MLTVQVVADGFALQAEESPQHELAVTVERPHPFVELHLTPDRPDEPVRVRTIQATYFVGAQPIGVAYRPVAVVQCADLLAEAAGSVAVAARVDLAIPSQYTDLDRTVQIADGDRTGDLLWTERRRRSRSGRTSGRSPSASRSS